MLKIKNLLGVDSTSAVSSVVEHFLDTEGVRGSNPLSRTTFTEQHSAANEVRQLREWRCFEC